MEQFVVWGEDLPRWVVVATLFICGIWVLSSLHDLRTWRVSSRLQKSVFLSALGAAFLVCLAVLRPATVRATVSSLGAKVVVLLDRARRMSIVVDGQSRASRADEVYRQLSKHYSGLRISTYEFGDKGLYPAAFATKGPPRAISEYSDLTAAFDELAATLGEKPAAIVVVSDGRWVRPAETDDARSFEVPQSLKGTLVHTIDVGGRLPKDASILSVQTVGASVAHQPLSLEVVVYCASELKCGKVPVTVREHKKGIKSQVLAQGEANFERGTTSRIGLEVVIERAGTRVLEVSIEPPHGDEIRENDNRYITLEVVKDRLRLLHVAGRPTYDVRALRTWLKSDSSVDLVSFFILRTDSDETNADDDSELALIPFPVDELFTEHLPSFDAVILEDIDAERYRLNGYFTNLAKYVEQGGGLLLVGGPSAFSGGAYAGGPLEPVLPVTLVRSEHPFDTVEFVPRVTSAGRAARLLEPLRLVLGERLPSMPGANTLGPAKPKAVVLWEHPSRMALPVKTGGAPAPMPVLAISEVGDGRVVTLGIDGTHRLAWGSDGWSTAGQAYGALWDGLLGWVMRERRFESASGELEGICIVGNSTKVRISFATPVDGEATFELQRLDATGSPRVVSKKRVTRERSVSFEFSVPVEGGYSGMVRVGDAPAARFDFACERGGSAWSDSRPDPVRLRRLAEVNGGTYVSASNVADIERPEMPQVTTFRQVTPWLPTWAWAFGASLGLAAHWLLRRLTGLT